ncbi:hypothetical protein E2C01_015224 [Portunus trituberculatus]|uniref:Uncharacterized protein n=1 Tax=Portunus trituberculatus TaxID=210409 RepID=A0A5B7DMD5_PORTR|nr:hypothetical protein [Portunus trituberculatus]
MWERKESCREAVRSVEEEGISCEERPNEGNCKKSAGERHIVSKLMEEPPYRYYRGHLLISSANKTLRPVSNCSFFSWSHPNSSSTSLISFSRRRAATT